MTLISRQRAAAIAAATVATLGAGAAPALAHSTASSTSTVTAKTPIVAKIAAETRLIGVAYDPSSLSILQTSVKTSDRAASAVSRVHANSAQLPAKLEWVLGADVQARGDIALYSGSTRAALADYRLSNYYLANADSLLGVRHPALSATPYHPYRTSSRGAAPSAGSANAPRTASATIAMATGLLRQTLPRDVEDATVTVSAAAGSYYSVLVPRMRVDAAQRAAVAEWVSGVRMQLSGEELLAKGALAHALGKAATGNRELKDALAQLRRSDSVISHADAALGIHTSGPTVSVPANPVYFKG